MTKVKKLRQVATLKAGKDFWTKDNIACIVNYYNAINAEHITTNTAMEWAEERATKDGISLLDASEAIKREMRSTYVSTRGE